MDSSAASQELTKHTSKPKVQDFSSGPETFHLTILIKNRSGVFSHYTLQCFADDTGIEIFDTLRRLHRKHTGVRWHHLRCVTHLFLMQRISIGTARIFEVNPTQHHRSIVELTFYRYNPSTLKTSDTINFCTSQIIHMMIFSLPPSVILLW